ncbi:MAG: hypothetical protein PVF87_11960 [Acidimicrobiia bacterium]|jgi:hypothetical protein
MEKERRLRFESGPAVTFAAGLVMAAVIALAILAAVTGSGFFVAMLIVVAVAALSGLLLDRLDGSRRHGSERDGNPDDYWGYRGRPGS